MKNAYLKKYVTKVDLEDLENAVSVRTHPLPIDSWKFYHKNELKNSCKTKFVSNQITDKRFIELEFAHAIPICAIGLRSANHFLHLDPSTISITCTIEGDAKEVTIVDKMDLNFDRRFQVKSFLKHQPTQLVKKFIIDIIETAGGQPEFELGEILVYTQIKLLD